MADIEELKLPIDFKLLKPEELFAIPFDSSFDDDEEARSISNADRHEFIRRLTFNR